MWTVSMRPKRAPVGAEIKKPLCCRSKTMQAELKQLQDQEAWGAGQPAGNADYDHQSGSQ